MEAVVHFASDDEFVRVVFSYGDGDDYTYRIDKRQLESFFGPVEDNDEDE